MQQLKSDRAIDRSIRLIHCNNVDDDNDDDDSDKDRSMCLRRQTSELRMCRKSDRCKLSVDLSDTKFAPFLRQLDWSFSCNCKLTANLARK